MKKALTYVVWSGMFLLIPAIVLAQSADASLPPDQFVEQVFQVIKTLGGLSWMLKISAICMLIVASMKVSFLDNLIWNRLGAWQKVVAPVLALLGGVLAYLGGSGVQPSMASFAAYFLAGAGSLALHELLDGIKSLPFLGPVYVSVIDVISKMLGGSSS